MQFKQYPSYKNSGVEWLGDVPDEWDIYPFWHLFNRKEITNKTQEQLLSVYLDRGVILHSEGGGMVHKPADNLEKYQLVEVNDFVMNNQQAWRGSVGVSPYKGIVSPAYLIFSFNKKICAPKFFKYFLRDKGVVDQFMIASMSVGTIQRQVKWHLLKTIQLSIPSLIEQNTIANFLDTETARIDNLIAKQEKLIELLEEQRKSIISHAVTKGLNPNAPMKDSGVEWLGEVPESWVEQKIKFISKLINEKTSEKSNVIALENIESWTGKYIETESSFDSDAVKFKKNDVLFGKLRPYLAKVYLVENQGEAVGDIYVLRPNKLIHPQFLKFFMLSEKFIDYVNSSTNGTKMPRANWDFIGCISIFLPHIKVQHEIVEYLESAVLKIELIINKQISLIEKLKEYRSSIISHSVTGKIDIREFC
ncbi:restriction endonuclease subunit S [Acinetobacter baumannii]|uniref:restriction endonuclease subunit S n=1 Tax=Acinetobacter baumannii TaxID=470 RepID=UPI00396C8C6C